MAGMEAAAVAARRGHDVTLGERSDRLGGILSVLGAPPTRQSWRRAVKGRARMLREAGVSVRMNTEATADLVQAERPDVLIAATGARPFIPKYAPGWGSRRRSPTRAARSP